MILLKWQGHDYFDNVDNHTGIQSGDLGMTGPIVNH